MNMAFRSKTTPTRLSTRLKKAATALVLGTFSSLSLAMDQVTFQLDWLPGGDKAPIYVGMEQGYFKEQGIEIKISHGRGSTDALTKISTGIADVGLSDLVALLVAKANDQVPISAVYSVFSQAPHAFFTVSDSNISSVAQVEGKKIATSPFTSSNIFLPLLFSVNNVDESKVNVVKANPGALNPMLLTGNTDVVISWITDVEKYKAQAAKAGKSLTVLPWYDAGLDFYSTAVVASDRFLAERPDVAKRFIKAFDKAVKYTWENPEKSGSAVHKIVPEVEVDVAADTIRSIHTLVHNDVSKVHGLGHFDSTRLATTWKWTAKAQGLQEGAFNPETAVNRDYFSE
ncbi:MAG: ABC transporter substrate-binding protein [Pseudomonadales bacterium]|nr:ABC transporter substrate-binding protein [Pseudomonadales bacterium]